MTNRQRLEAAIEGRRVFWHRHGTRPRRVFLTVPMVRGYGRTSPGVSRPLTSQERKILRELPVRYMRRRDDAPGVSRGIVLMAE